MVKQYTDPIWGRLKKLRIPSCIVDKRTQRLVLDDYALNVLVALYTMARNQALRRSYRSQLTEHDYACIMADQRILERQSGMSRRLVGEGIRSLVGAGLIQVTRSRDRYEQFAANEYVLLNPKDGSPLKAPGSSSLLSSNGLHYFAIPMDCLQRHPVTRPNPWSLRSMKLPHRRLYIILCWLAAQREANEYQVTAQEVKNLARLKHPAFRTALDELEARRLVWNQKSGSTLRNLSLQLRHPRTGELLSAPTWDRIDQRNNPCNWTETDVKGNKKRARLRMSAEEEQALFLKITSERGVPVRKEGHYEYKLCCPFHNESNPSCNFNPLKDCFHCFACKEKGTGLKLFTKLQGSSKAQAIERIANAMGKSVEYIEPDRNAVAIYDYRSEKGTLLKQVLRYPNVDGRKRILQRRPSVDGWNWNVRKLGPMLYNAEFLMFARTVYVCEGEKDTKAIADLDPTKLITAVTSGSADSWEPQLAKKLAGKHVVIVPDDDEAGTRYADAVEASLQAEGIEYKRISLAGTGCKDATEYIERYGEESLQELIEANWVSQPDGTWAQVETATATLAAQGAGADCAAYEEQITV